MLWSVDTLCLTGISVTLNTLEINWWIIWIKVVDICFMFNLLTMLDELFTTQWREIAAVFVLSCCVFTQFAVIGKSLTTLITAVNLFIIILFTITFIITLVVRCEKSIAVGTDLLPAVVQGGRASEASCLCTRSQALRCGRRRGLRQLVFQLLFPVLHPDVLPQPLFRNIGVLTMDTGKLGFSYLFDWRFHSWQRLPFLEEEFLVEGINSEQYPPNIRNQNSSILISCCQTLNSAKPYLEWWGS